VRLSFGTVVSCLDNVTESSTGKGDSEDSEMEPIVDVVDAKKSKRSGVAEKISSDFVVVPSFVAISVLILGSAIAAVDV